MERGSSDFGELFAAEAELERGFFLAPIMTEVVGYQVLRLGYGNNWENVTVEVGEVLKPPSLKIIPDRSGKET